MVTSRGSRSPVLQGCVLLAVMALGFATCLGRGGLTSHRDGEGPLVFGGNPEFGVGTATPVSENSDSVAFGQFNLTNSRSDTIILEQISAVFAPSPSCPPLEIRPMLLAEGYLNSGIGAVTPFRAERYRRLAEFEPPHAVRPGDAARLVIAMERPANCPSGESTAVEEVVVRYTTFDRQFEGTYGIRLEAFWN